MRRIVWAGAAAVAACAALSPAALGSSATKAAITLDHSRGQAGAIVTGTGAGFDYWSQEAVPERVPSEDGLEGVPTNPGPARIHWNSLEDGVVWEGSPGLDGRIEFSFRVPADAEPGTYTVVATQTGYDGRPTGGTPARATFRVVASSGPAPAVTPLRGRPRRDSGRPGARDTVDITTGSGGRLDGRGPGEQRERTARGEGRGRAVATPLSVSAARGGTSSTGSRVAPATRGAPARNVPPGSAAREPASRRITSAAPAAPPASGSGSTTLSLLGALAAGAVAGAGIALLVRRRRSPEIAAPLTPTPPAAAPDALSEPYVPEPDPLDAELQELLAGARELSERPPTPV